jgi:hypothetical protein
MPRTRAKGRAQKKTGQGGECTYWGSWIFIISIVWKINSPFNIFREMKEIDIERERGRKGRKVKMKKWSEKKK